MNITEVLERWKKNDVHVVWRVYADERQYVFLADVEKSHLLVVGNPTTFLDTLLEIFNEDGAECSATLTDYDDYMSYRILNYRSMREVIFHRILQGDDVHIYECIKVEIDET